MGHWKHARKSASCVIVGLVAWSGSHAQHGGATKEHPFDPCAEFPQLADAVVMEERSFLFEVDKDAEPVDRVRGFDHEYGAWNWADGRHIEFQYGFDVTSLADWTDDRSMMACTFDLDGVPAAYFEGELNGQPTFGIGLFDYVESYSAPADAGHVSGVLTNDLAIIGAGRSDAIFATGRNLARSFRWSRLPNAAWGAWSVSKTTERGVAMFPIGRYGLGTLQTMSGDGMSGWQLATQLLPILSDRVKVRLWDEDVFVVALPVDLWPPSGNMEASMDPLRAKADPWGRGELLVSLTHDCNKAQFRWRQASSDELHAIDLAAIAPALECSRFAK